MSSFYSQEELADLGLKSFGKNVLISRNTCIYGAEKITVGDNVRIDDFCVLSGNITIGNYVHVAVFVALFGGDEGIELKDFVGVSSRSAVYAASDDYSGEALSNPTVSERYRKVYGGKVTLEKHVVVGTGCTILPGVTIGEGSSVGSMSLVNKSLDSWGMYLGIPCRKFKDRSKKLLELEAQLLEGETLNEC